MKKDQLKQKAAQKATKKEPKKAQKKVQTKDTSDHLELINEIKAYNRAHNRLIRKLKESYSEPTFILATLHAVHAISMKYEQEAVQDLITARRQTSGQK